MPYEIEKTLTTASGQTVYAFIFYNIRSTGYFITYDSQMNVQFKNADYAEFESIHVFDEDSQPYTITPADESIWADDINESIKSHFRKVA